jgi:hypothetical protein
MPKAWDKFALRNIHSFGTVFDLEISRTGKGKLEILVKKGDRVYKYQVKEGTTQLIKL